jgi:hypothetical protein
VPDENLTTRALRRMQAEREAEEREREREADAGADTEKAGRRAEKAAYLKQKLEERARSERARDSERDA